MEKSAKSVILVEDEDIGTDIKRSFETLKDPWTFQVTWVKSLEHLSERLGGTERFDVGIIDMWIPRYTADIEYRKIDACGGEAATIHTLKDNPWGLLFVYTGHSSLEDCILAMKAGAHDFVNKASCTPAELADRVVAALKEKEAQEERHRRVEEQVIPRHPEWLEKYGGEVVAILGDEIVAHGPNRLAVLLEVWKTKPSAKPYFLHIGRNQGGERED